jgi:hypothetical protein
MIYSKLLEFQKLGIKLNKEGENPHFKSSYVTLNEVLAKVVPELNKLGIVVIQKPDTDYYLSESLDMSKSSILSGLRTVLYDTGDNTQVECFMPYVEATTAQKLGSNNTYNRRYSLITLLGLEDTDDDGEVASTPQKQPSKGVVDRNDEPFPTEEGKKEITKEESFESEIIWD